MRHYLLFASLYSIFTLNINLCLYFSIDFSVFSFHFPLFIYFHTIFGAFALQIIPFRSTSTSTVVIFINVSWLSLGVAWLVKFYMNSPIGEAKEIMLGKKMQYESVEKQPNEVKTYQCLHCFSFGK